MDRSPHLQHSPLTPPKNYSQRYKDIQYAHENQKLKTEIRALHSYINRRDIQHQRELDQLTKENKHFSHQIMRLQEELTSCRDNDSRRQREQKMLLEIKPYVQNAERELKKREEREVLVVEENDFLRRTVESLRGLIDQLRGDKESLLKERDVYTKEEKRIVESSQKKMQEMEIVVPQLIDAKKKIEEEVEELKKEGNRIRAENEGLKKDLECLLELITAS